MPPATRTKIGKAKPDPATASSRQASSRASTPVSTPKGGPPASSSAKGGEKKAPTKRKQREVAPPAAAPDPAFCGVPMEEGMEDDYVLDDQHLQPVRQPATELVLLRPAVSLLTPGARSFVGQGELRAYMVEPVK